jgi:hypothetical protein
MSYVHTHVFSLCGLIDPALESVVHVLYTRWRAEQNLPRDG